MAWRRHDLDRTSVTQDHWIFIVAQLEKKKKPMRPGQLDQHSATKIDSSSFTCLLDLDSWRHRRCVLSLAHNLLKTCISKPLLRIFQFIQNMKPASSSHALLPRMISWRSARQRALIRECGRRPATPLPLSLPNRRPLTLR